MVLLTFSLKRMNENKFPKKKILRKQLRSLCLLAKHEDIETKDWNSSQTSKYLLISNGGLMCELSYEELFDCLTTFGEVKDILLIPQKPYALIEFKEESEALNARNDLNSNFCHQLNRQLNVSFICRSLWDRVLENNKQRIREFSLLFDSKPNGLVLIEEFIDGREEEQVLLFVSFIPFIVKKI